MSDLSDVIGRFLLSERDRRAITQKQMAALLGMTRSRLGRIECGTCDMMPIEEVERICDRLHLRLIDLLGWCERGAIAIKRMGAASAFESHG